MRLFQPVIEGTPEALTFSKDARVLVFVLPKIYRVVLKSSQTGQALVLIGGQHTKRERAEIIAAKVAFWFKNEPIGKCY
jgi:hypothetical protein